jgi:hypothetical protein
MPVFDAPSYSSVSQGSDASSRSSKVRQHYLIVPPDSDDSGLRLGCRHCAAVYAKSTGSSILARHLKKCHPDTVRAPDPRQTTLADYVPLPKTREKAFIETVYDWMVADLQDYSVIEQPQFVAMIKALCPSITLPVRQTAKQHISCKFDLTRAMVVDALLDVDCCSLTTDGWTSVGSHQFLSLTCHHLDKGWHPKSIVLDCIPFQQAHTGAEIKTAILRLLEEFGLVGKVCAITTDSASNMIAAMRDLSAEMRTLGHEIIHVRCGAHILHRIVTAGLESENQAIAEIRDSVASIRASPRLLARLDDLQKGRAKLRPILDVRTRWNSTFDMLKRALELKTEINGINALDISRRVQIAETAWDVAAMICRFLDLFNSATETLSSESVPSIASALAVFHRIKAHVREAISCPELANMAVPMMAKIESYSDLYSNASLVAASLLDPRTNFALEEYDQTSWIGGKRVLEEQFAALAVQEETVPVPATDAGQGLEKFLPPSRRRRIGGNELGRFFEHAEASCSVGLLPWWAANETTFPILARLARRYLTMQATSVPSERLFSTAGMIASASRSRLLPESVRELICLHNWIGALERP